MIRMVLFSLLSVGAMACVSPTVDISKMDGHVFVSCNLDRITEVKSLKLSEIAETCDFVILNEDSLAESDRIIWRVTVSDKYIVVIPDGRPALLYSREGAFLRRLVVPNRATSDEYGGISVQIDDHSDVIYIQEYGLKLWAFNQMDSTAMNIPIPDDNVLDFVVVGQNIFATVINRHSVWAFIQPLRVPRAEYLYGRTNDSTFNLALSGGLSMKADTIILSFLRRNDTSYYYTSKDKSFVPFLCCSSSNDSITKKLRLVGSQHYVFQIFGRSESYVVVDQSKRQAYYLDELLNDFWGGLSMNFKNTMETWQYVNNKDGYLTFHYTIGQLKKEISREMEHAESQTNKEILTHLWNDIKNEPEPRNALFIAKLKN